MKALLEKKGNVKNNLTDLNKILDELRTAFDHSFSAAIETTAEAMEHVLLFSLGEVCYAIPLYYTQEVLKVPYITRVPHAPPVIAGIMNLNGEIVSVCRISHILDMPSSETQTESRVLVTKNLPYTTGIFVDAVHGILSVSEQQIQPILSTISAGKADFIRGEFYTEDKLVILLDMKKLTSAPEMQIR
ncbi:MAG: purine-binding chemotaxis protein CheW [SAR324 cluster bacterium]|nr:purine-binding chemotaxis protein CheW [SAR324 cluster bacterium]